MRKGINKLETFGLKEKNQKDNKIARQPFPKCLRRKKNGRK